MKLYRLLYNHRLCHSVLLNNQRACSHQSRGNISYLEISDQVTNEKKKIAYERTSGSSQSEVLYIPGFMSHLSGVKAESLFNFCKRNNITYTRYDPSGLGASKWISLDKARLSHWVQDAEAIFNSFKNPKIVVASSLGGWIALKLCQKYSTKFQALILLAPGVNVTSYFVDKISKNLPKTVLENLERGGIFELNHPDYGIFPLSQDLVKDLYKNEIDLSSSLKVPFPVRIIHGTREWKALLARKIKDEDVNYKNSLELMEKIESDDLQVILIKDAHHRLSTEKNLMVLHDTLKKLIELVKED